MFNSVKAIGVNLQSNQMLYKMRTFFPKQTKPKHNAIDLGDEARGEAGEAQRRWVAAGPFSGPGGSIPASRPQPPSPGREPQLQVRIPGSKGGQFSGF